MQAAGRAGRGSAPGEVVIQTYDPEHYSIKTAAKQDYQAFYREELEFRDRMGYPPVENMLAVLMMGEEENLLNTAAEYLKAYAERIGGNYLEVIGPAVPYIGNGQ